MNRPIATRVQRNTIRARASGKITQSARWLLAVVIPVTIAAQTPSSAQRDSLAERLQRAEDAIRLLREQAAEQATTAARARSRMSVELHGRVLVNTFSNSRRVNNQDVPQVVRPDPERGSGNDALGMAIRQTTLGVVVEASSVLGGSFTGDLDVDFFGGQMPSTGGRTFPLLRLRTARGVVAWSHAELVIGQESPLVAGVNPVSLASVGTPGFAAAGNLWLWLPQVRVTAEFGERVRIGLQGAVLAPTSGDTVGLFETGVDSAEQTRMPYLQSRLRVQWGEDEGRGEVGVGLHQGWIRTREGGATPPGPIIDEVSEGVHVDLVVPFGRWVEIRGEGYRGQALRGLGGGGVGQGIVSNAAGRGIPVRDEGGWAQLNIMPRSRVSPGIGCGRSDPNDDDLSQPAAPRLRNEVCEAHVMLRPAGPLIAAIEIRRLKTTYRSGPFTANHLNLALGFTF